MVDKATRLRYRRLFKRRRRQVEDFSAQTNQRLERHFFRRLLRLKRVRRFVLAWLGLLVFMIGGTGLQLRALTPYYKKEVPIAGGSYSEGVIGVFTGANPLFASSSVDSAVSRLLFAGLLMADQNGRLRGDLAESWAADSSGLKYTVTLRSDLRWHDQRPLTARDVVFTYQTIQNPDVQSPLFSGWQGIKVSAESDRVVVFTLPNPLSSFPYALTNGIVPQHLLSSLQPAQFRTAAFNTLRPVGSGPFKWGDLQVSGNQPGSRREQISLLPFAAYHGGAPKLKQFVLTAFRDDKQLLESFRKGEVQGMAGLLNEPAGPNKSSQYYTYDLPISAETMVFFKNQGLLADKALRQALVRSANVGVLAANLPYPVIAARGPLLKNMLGYDPNLTQLPYDPSQAALLLDQAGWLKSAGGIRQRGSQKLEFTLTAQDTPDYAIVTRQLQADWRAIGVDVRLNLLADDDIQQAVNRHDYQALLYGIALGSDPDVFAYWHSTQADPHSPTRTNLSEYRSTVADKALEAGRTRADPKVRAVKYRPFLEAWRADAPALALYQPRFLYITSEQIYNFDVSVVTTAADRYANVNNWMIRRGYR